MYKVNKCIKDLYRVGTHESRKECLRLDMNENPSGLPDDFFKKVINRITPSLLAMYPENEKVILKLSNYLHISKENITITNGSDDAIKGVFHAFGGNNKTLVSVYPTFEMYRVYALMFEMKHHVINYNNDFSVSVKQILEAIDENVSIVALLNPNNPIGTVYSVEEVITIVKRARQANSVVIIDEAYYYFYERTLIDLVKKYDNVILIRTFSKLCSIAGLRIGYVVSNPEIIKYINNVSPTYSVNAVALEFAYAILDETDLIKRLIEKERCGKKYLVNKLTENGYTCKAQKGNYVFVKPNRKVIDTYEKLKKEHILVKTYKNELLKDYIRITTGGKNEMKKFLDCFLKIDAKN